METIIGLVAGALTSFGFVPQIVRGLKTKRMEDVSYYIAYNTCHRHVFVACLRLASP